MRRRATCLFLLAMTTLAGTSGATWEDISPATLGVAPFRLSQDPTDPDRLFLGTYGEGLYRSTNGGQTWTQVYDDFDEGNGAATVLVVDTEFNPNDPSQGIAVTISGPYFSLDGGVSWTRDPANDQGNAPLSSWDVIAIPDGSGAVASELGEIFSGGTFWLYDWSAMSWTPGSVGLQSPAGESNLGIDFGAGTPPRLYGGNTFRCYWTTDLGQTMNWNNVGLPDKTMRAVAGDPEIEGRAVCAVDGGIFRQTTAGGTWAPWGSGVSGLVFSIIHGVEDPEVMFAGTENGVFRSDDRGATFSPVTTDGMTHTNVFHLTIHPDEPGLLYATATNGTSTAGGVYRLGISETVAVEEAPVADARRLRVAPNPTRAHATMTFALDAAGAVKLLVFDASGRLVRRVLDASLPAGSHEATWDTRDESGALAPSGTYFARIETGGSAHAQRIALVR